METGDSGGSGQYDRSPGQRHTRADATTRLTLDFEGAAVPLDDPLCDGEAQTRASALGGEARLSDPPQIVGGNPEAVVHEPHSHPLSRGGTPAQREGAPFA